MRWVFDGLCSDGYGAAVVFARLKSKADKARPLTKQRGYAARAILERTPTAASIPMDAQIISIDIGQIYLSFSGNASAICQ